MNWLAATVVTSTTSTLTRRALSDYQEVFPGVGGPDEPSSRDASIEGPAYLTFKVVNNATYNIAECVDFCSGIPKCGMSFHSSASQWRVVTKSMPFRQSL